MMRVVLVVVGALITLGLAAFGVVAAQQAAGPASLIALAAHVISPGQSSGAAPAPSQPVQAQTVQRPVPAPVIQVAQTTAALAVEAPARLPHNVGCGSTDGAGAFRGAHPGGGQSDSGL